MPIYISNITFWGGHLRYLPKKVIQHISIDFVLVWKNWKSKSISGMLELTLKFLKKGQFALINHTFSLNIWNLFSYPRRTREIGGGKIQNNYSMRNGWENSTCVWFIIRLRPNYETHIIIIFNLLSYLQS